MQIRYSTLVILFFSIILLLILSIASPAVIAVFAAGLLAGFNPCLLAMLAFLASTMLAGTDRRKEILSMVVFFSLGTFFVYIIFGMGLLGALQEESKADIFRFVLVATLLILGLMQIEDARRLKSGGTSLFRVDWSKKYVHGVIASRKRSSYFLLGALFSLVRAPCIGGMYVAVIGLISSQGNASSGVLYLIIYSLGIALPVLIFGGVIALGLSPEQADQFRQNHRIGIRLITGITLIVLAILIYLDYI